MCNVCLTNELSKTTSNWVISVSLLVCFTKEASATTSNWVISVSNCVFFASIASAVVSISPFLVRILSKTALLTSSNFTLTSPLPSIDKGT